jgi:hypothetical protein
MEEYRAFYVGFMAEHGRPPNRSEIVSRVKYMVTATNNAYNYIRLALQGEQGDLMLDFINRLLGRSDVTRNNIVECLDEAEDALNDKTVAILPEPPGDMDN